MVSVSVRGMGTGNIFKMAAAMLQINGCVEIENLIELCAIPKQKIQLNGCISDSPIKVCIHSLVLGTSYYFLKK